MSRIFVSFMLIAALVSICMGLVDFPVYRLFQLDAYKIGQENSKEFDKLGSHKSPADGSVILYKDVKGIISVETQSGANNSSFGTKFLKRIVYADILSFDKDEDVFASLKIAAEHGAAGIVLVIPRFGRVPPAAAHAWRKLEAHLFTEAFPESCAVYVAFLEDVPHNVASGISVNLAINAKPLIPMNGPKQKGAFELANVVATLEGGHGESEQLPTIAVVANYDTFGIAPALAVAAAESAGPVSVLMELHRLFSILYTGNSRPEYNMQFVLTSGAALNYAGLRAWASRQDSAPEFVLCLDSLLDDNGSPFEVAGFAEQPYFLHVSKPGKDAAVKAIYDALVLGAKVSGAKLDVMQKKVNVAREEFEWPHEALAVKRFLAATLTRRQTPAAEGELLLARPTLLDRVIPDCSTLSRATRIAAEGLVRILYAEALKQITDEQESCVFHGKLGLSGTNLAGWARALSERNRCMPAASQKDSELLQALQSAISPSVIQEWPLAGNEGQQKRTPGKLVVEKFDQEDDEVATAPAKVRYVFYSWPLNIDTNVKCVVHSRTPALWDLFMLLFTVVFLFLLYAVLHGFSATINDAVSLFMKPKRD